MAKAERDELNVAVVRGNRPLLFLAIGHLDAADEELQELMDESNGEPLPFVRRTRALIAEARGDDLRARGLCADAMGALQSAGEFATSADLELLGARIDGRNGQSDRARTTAQRILREAERAGSPLIATEAANSLAEILVLAAASDSASPHLLAEAERHAEEARSVAEATGDRAEVARSDAILSRIAFARHDDDAAAARSHASAQVYSAIGHRLRPT